MRVLGIDPGTNRIGYGLVSSSKNTLTAIAHGVIEIPPKTETQHRIKSLGDQFSQLLKNLKPTHIGIESLFFSKNKKTALSVAEARGVLLFLALQCNVPVIECQPNKVKMAVTNYGNADKRAVAKMVRKILRIPEIEGRDDASDALAVAITAANEFREQKNNGRIGG